MPFHAIMIGFVLVLMIFVILMIVDLSLAKRMFELREKNYCIKINRIRYYVEENVRENKKKRE